MKKKLENDFSFMPYAPMIFISAMTGQRVGNLYEMIKKVDEQNARRISTGMLNDMLSLRHRAGAAAVGQGQAPEDLLHDPGFHPAAGIRLLCQQSGAVPLLLSAVSGKPDPGEFWL